MALDNIEAVKKVTETMSKQSPNPAEDMERMSSNKEHFQSLIDSPQQTKPTSFERIDNKAFAVEESSQPVETQPVFAEENVSTQKNGSATDQERKHGRQSDTDDEIEGVAATDSKKSTGSSSTFMEEVGKSNISGSPTSPVSPESLKTQAKGAISQLDQVKTQLSQTQTEIKPAYQTLLRNRLTHIDDNLKIALSKVGVESPSSSPTATAGKGSSPVQRLISMVSDSQHQLENMHNNIEKLSLTGEISPGNMLTIQIKMGYIQQQIELFTSLLNKALESTKTIMNVQV